ncbi:hypothetical protein OAG24_01120 [bacterium]|nr:hypothetical protein [bacterium]
MKSAITRYCAVHVIINKYRIPPGDESEELMKMLEDMSDETLEIILYDNEPLI